MTHLRALLGQKTHLAREFSLARACGCREFCEVLLDLLFRLYTAESDFFVCVFLRFFFLRVACENFRTQENPTLVA